MARSTPGSTRLRFCMPIHSFTRRLNSLLASCVTRSISMPCVPGCRHSVPRLQPAHANNRKTYQRPPRPPLCPNKPSSPESFVFHQIPPKWTEYLLPFLQPLETKKTKEKKGEITAKEEREGFARGTNLQITKTYTLFKMIWTQLKALPKMKKSKENVFRVFQKTFLCLQSFKG